MSSAAPAPPRARLPWLLFALAALAAGALLWEGRRTAELAGEFEVAARATAQQLGATERSLVAASNERERLRAEVQRLEDALDRALTFSNSLGEALVRESEVREQAAVAQRSREALVAVPPPLGVQSCLGAFADCLRADGFIGMRLLTARSLQDGALEHVEFLDTAGGDADAELIVAARLTARLDRAAAAIVLRFEDGFRRVLGVRADLPPGGHEVRLAPVTGPMWEQRLPSLVQAEGAYPAPRAPTDRPAPRGMDALTRAEWIDRFDLLLGAAGTDLRLRVTGFADLVDGEFTSARVCGYDQGNLLALAADCDRLAVEVDEQAGIVSLRLAGGTLRRDGTESTIHAEGYRMLLPTVTPALAKDRMLGMVVRR